MGQKDKALDGFLVASARAGDDQALSRLVRHRSPRLLAHAARLLGDRETARDVLQEAWADIIRSLPNLANPSAFLPWALRIVSRKVAREISKRQSDRRLSEEYAYEAESELAFDDSRLDAKNIHAAINALPPNQKATVALFYLEELTVREVATALDVPLGTVKTRLLHARANLRKTLTGETNDKT